MSFPGSSRIAQRLTARLRSIDDLTDKFAEDAKVLIGATVDDLPRSIRRLNEMRARLMNMVKDVDQTLLELGAVDEAVGTVAAGLTGLLSLIQEDRAQSAHIAQFLANYDDWQAVMAQTRPEMTTTVLRLAENPVWQEGLEKLRKIDRGRFDEVSRWMKQIQDKGN